MAFPASTKYVIVGAGIHGLSAAYHLALELKSKGTGDGSDILVVDKTSIAAGASGISSSAFTSASSASSDAQTCRWALPLSQVSRRGTFSK